MKKAVSFPSQGNVNLQGTVFSSNRAKAIVVIHPATGVPQAYYEAFAAWLSKEKNVHVLTYSYRDAENITKQDQRASKATMVDWGIHDQSAALDFALATYPKLRTHTIGHSLGGFCFPFHESNHKVASHIAVNSGPALWYHHPIGSIPKVMLFWFVLGPLLTKLTGSMPGFLLGMKNDVPAGVYWQWRRWCTNEKFYEVDFGKSIPKPDLNRYQNDLYFITAKDDDIIPPARAKVLQRYFPKCTAQITTVAPADLGLKTIGHIGIFAKRSAPVWPIIAASL